MTVTEEEKQKEKEEKEEKKEKEENKFLRVGGWTDGRTNQRLYTRSSRT